MVALRWEEVKGSHGNSWRAYAGRWRVFTYSLAYGRSGWQLDCYLTAEKHFQGIFYTEEAAKAHAQQVLDAWIKGLNEEREG